MAKMLLPPVVLFLLFFVVRSRSQGELFTGMTSSPASGGPEGSLSAWSWRRGSWSCSSTRRACETAPSLSGRFGLTRVPAEGVKRLDTPPTQATKSMADDLLGEAGVKPPGKKALPCPFDVTKLKDSPNCGKAKGWMKEACDDGSNSTDIAMKITVQRLCKQMCNPGCDPTRPTSRMDTGVNYIPLANLVQERVANLVQERGHQFCKDRYTVSTQPEDNKINRATGQVVQMPVCGECISDKYYLRPAYASGGQVFGNCALLTKNPLWIQANKKCSPQVCTPTGQDEFNMCVQFGGGWGIHEGTDKALKAQKAQKKALKSPRGGHTAGQKGFRKDVSPPPNMPASFTCARTYVVNPFEGCIAQRGTKTWQIVKRVYNIVQTTTSSCHSAEEDYSGLAAPRMKCVNKKVLKSCHVKKLTRNVSACENGKCMSKIKDSACAKLTAKSPEMAAALKDLKEKVIACCLSLKY